MPPLSMLKKTLVIGASANPSRYSNIAIHMLREANQPIIALGLRAGVVDGVTITSEKKQFEDIHTITLYIGARNQPPYYEYVLSLQPKRVIFNPGTENPEFEALLSEHGIDAEVACTLVLLRTNSY